MHACMRVLVRVITVEHLDKDQKKIEVVQNKVVFNAIQIISRICVTHTGI